MCLLFSRGMEKIGCSAVCFGTRILFKTNRHKTAHKKNPKAEDQKCKVSRSLNMGKSFTLLGEIPSKVVIYDLPPFT